MQPLSREGLPLAGAFLLALASIASAHGQDDGTRINMGDSELSPPTVDSSPTPAESSTYFHYSDHSRMMVGHIILMAIGWVFILPIGVMLSICGSRYCFPVRFLFLATNAVGVLLATIYNASTPNLYPNNAHHKLGWILTWVASTQPLMGIIGAHAHAGRKGNSKGHGGRETCIPISVEAMAAHQPLNSLRFEQSCRFSNDSGQGTELNTESLRSQSISSTRSNNPPLAEMRHELEDVNLEETAGLLGGSRLEQVLSKRISRLLSAKVQKLFQFFYNSIDRSILMLGWVSILTGVITYGGFFIGTGVFSGLAHFIKGSVFFWFGIMSLGRWAGCWASIGWAWNVNTSVRNRPSAEFVESFMIFIYGVTNVSLEHLAAWGSAWTTQDLEHLSITFLFIGGGLCGMLVESRRVRDLLNVTSSSKDQKQLGEKGPKSYGFSTNPLPGLVTLLVGVIMSSHHQDSMVSTMIHKQWGNMLVGGAFARGATYVIFYLKPPTSALPGRPPTEIITAFCLMAGGFIFMVSARDTVTAIEANGLDAIFVFAISTGLITFLMAWIVFVIAVKGWAVKKEPKSTSSYHFFMPAA
ncbi:integral membrane protein-like protein [Amylocarpus encephaloides]|uniref:Integral membrane protein-like protein n=1 Tax=Amylocarpus encephaloides TaxID=45428 RepID=A0A9P7Y9R1_9HELO|nr:integral membrane protein-like protein [Amylocarpus encephaloides]